MEGRLAELQGLQEKFSDTIFSSSWLYTHARKENLYVAGGFDEPITDIA
jgi:hypothetical protein